MDIVSRRRGRIRGVNLHEPAGRVRVTRTIDEASPASYDTLLVPSPGSRRCHGARRNNKLEAASKASSPFSVLGFTFSVSGLRFLVFGFLFVPAIGSS